MVFNFLTFVTLLSPTSTWVTVLTVSQQLENTLQLHKTNFHTKIIHTIFKISKSQYLKECYLIFWLINNKSLIIYHLSPFLSLNLPRSCLPDFIRVFLIKKYFHTIERKFSQKLLNFYLWLIPEIFIILFKSWNLSPEAHILFYLQV